MPQILGEALKECEPMKLTFTLSGRVKEGYRSFLNEYRKNVQSFMRE